MLRWRALTHVARVTSSQALAADALHYSSDLISSVLVLAGLAATRAGYPHADALAAIGVAGFIAVAGFRLGRATIDALVDRAPAGLTEAVRSLVIGANGVAANRGDPAAADRPQDRGRRHRLGLAHPAARARRGDQGRAGSAHRPAVARGRTDPHRQSAQARRRNDPRARAGDRGAARPAGAPRHHPGDRRAQVRRPRSRSRPGDAARRRPHARLRARRRHRRGNRRRRRGRNPHRAGRAGGAAGNWPSPISRAASRLRWPRRPRRKGDCATSTMCACARRPAESLCFSTAASIRRRRSRPSTTRSMRSSARCAGRFPRRAGSSATPSRRATRRAETPSRGSSPSKVAISSRSRRLREALALSVDCGLP